MQKQFDDFEKFINEELEREAEEIERELQKHPELASLKASDSLKEKIDAEIEAMERERLISQLSEEDREALLLGREVRKEKEEEQKRREKRRKAGRWKRLVAAAAVVVIVASVGITSVGGPKRVAKLVQQAVEERQVEKVISVKEGEQGLILGNEEEENAYQQIKDKLGFEPVKLTIAVDAMKYKYMELDEYLQTVNMIYELDGMNVSYIMQYSYADDVWSVDTDDILVNEYEKSVDGHRIIIREYNIKGTEKYKYVGSFEYQNVYYRITAIVEKEKFEKIINNLHFS